MKTIPLTQGHVAKVDDADYERVAQFKWHIKRYSHTIYATAHVPGNARQKVLLHRVIMDAAPGVEIDHIDRDGLNCQRSNLRASTHKQNNGNKQKRKDSKVPYKGITWHAQSSRWRVRVAKQHIGMFDDPVEAAKAYDVAAKKQWGEFAYLNFPEEI